MDKKGHHYTNRGHDVNKMPINNTMLPSEAVSGLKCPVEVLVVEKNPAK
jgi:hypothetical protein